MTAHKCKRCHKEHSIPAGVEKPNVLAPFCLTCLTEAAGENALEALVRGEF